MIRSTNLKVALSHLSSRPKQALVAILSVTFGISMYIFMNSFMNGVNDIQTDLAFSTLSHIRIYNDLPEDKSNLLQASLSENQVLNLRSAKVIKYTDGIRNSQEILNLLQEEKEIEAFSPQVNLNVFFRNGASQRNGQLAGIDVINENRLFKTSDYMKEGDWISLKYRGDGIILGIGLARRLGLNTNDIVQVSTSNGAIKDYKIIGIIETTIAGVDNSKAYVRISSARALISENQSYVTDIQVNIQDYAAARSLGERLDKIIPYRVESWMEANGQLEAGSQLRNIIALAVSFTILIVAGFGIYNIMNMTVNEKIREIAILKAMGFDGVDIVQIFLTQSILIGVIGGLVGLTLGFGISAYVDTLPFEVGGLDTLPIAYRIIDYTQAFLFGILTTFIAGYLPAHKASKVDPVAIIRG